MLVDFLGKMEEVQNKEFQELVLRLETSALEKKEGILNIIKKFFPIFWEVNETDLKNAKTGFLHNGIAKKDIGLSGFGASGVIVDGLLFAFYRNSYCHQLTIAVHNGNDEANILGSICLECGRYDERLSEILKRYGKPA